MSHLHPDRSCFYPIPTSDFDISTYLGVWYQVAGYVAVFDAACKCITANYTLNDDGTVGVVNTCQSLGLPVSISGYASASDAAYGETGVFDVVLAGSGGICPGPNYIVQGDFALFFFFPSSNLSCFTVPCGLPRYRRQSSELMC